MKNCVGMRLDELLTLKKSEDVLQIKEIENPYSVEKLLKEGVKSLRNEDYIEALSSFKAILIISASNIKAMNNLAVTYYKMGRSERAVEYLEKILLLEPENESAKENIQIIKSNY